MKFKVVAVVAMAVLVAGVAEGAEKRKSSKASYESSSRGMGGGHRMAGCGLGSMAIEDNNKWAQVGASFLNGTGMQTFGISFGTSNCTEDGVAMAGKEKEAFVEANFSDLRHDMAAGEGEYLASLAHFYGCQGSDVKAFSGAMHKNQAKFSDVSAEGASDVIDAVVAQENAGCQG